MIVDFRYHIASLVAVFLALGLGILIGTAMMGGDVLVKQQAALISRLEQDFNTVRSEKRVLMEQAGELESDLARNRQFESAVVPQLVKDRLFGRQVALLGTTDVLDPAMVERIRTVLKQAGANVVSTTRIVHLPDLLDDARRNKVAGVLKLQPDQEGKGFTEAQVVEALTKEVAADIATGANLALPSLAKLKLVQTNGEYGASVQSVVVITGRGEEPRSGTPRVDDVLVGELTGYGLDVVGVEASDVPFSQMKAFSGKRVATVDNVDTAPGLLSLVIALQGSNGSFGVKPTAKQFIPDLSLAPQ